MRTRYVYIDESEIGGNILLGAVIVPDQHRYMVARRLDDLRRRMLREMQAYRYPILDPARAAHDRTSRQRTERQRLASGGLPEVHTAELWTGDEVFWKERDGTSVLFDRHLRWLRAALSLVNDFQLTYHLNALPLTRQQELQAQPETDIATTLARWLTRDISVKKLRQLQHDPFVRTLFGFMQSLEVLARREGWRYRLICDRGKKNEMFQTFDTFATLKAHGSWQHLETIEFQESHDNALLQLSDAITYVEAKATWLSAAHKDRPLASCLQQHYLRRAYRPTPPPVGAISGAGFFAAPSLAYAELMAMLTEMALLHCGGTAASLPLRQARLRQVLALYPDIFLGHVQP